MKFAFASHSPTADLPALAIQAKALGYDGVEVHGSRVDTGILRRSFTDAGLEVCCLAVPTVYSRAKRVIAADELKQAIQLTAAAGAPLVKLPANQGRAIDPIAFGDWLMPLGDMAAAAGVCIVIENGFTWSTARSVWSLLDRIDHPSIACCWNLAHAIDAGQSPAVAVPMLNSKIRYAQVGGIKDEPPQPLLPLQRHASTTEKFIKRLRGIGYTHYVTVTGTDSPECLSHALAKLRHWDQRLKISDAEAAAREQTIPPATPGHP